MKKWICLAFVLLLMASMAPSLAEGDLPVIMIGKSGSGSTLPEGHDLENYNYYLDYAEKYAGVDVQFAWCLEDDGQKIALALASGNMPDAMIVGRTTFEMLYKSDMILDITELFDEVSKGTILEEVYESFPESFKMGMLGGKLMALPNTAQQYENPVLWLRKDWLDKLDLQAPSTLEELEVVLDAFVNNDPDGNGVDDTIGMEIIDTVFSVYNSNNGMETIAALFGAYPRIWYLDEDGNAVYGSVTEGTRDTLEYLNKLYEAGYIDKEFAMNDDAVFTEKVVSGKCGLAFGRGALAANQLQNSHAYDDTADWIPVLCPLDENGVFHSRLRCPSTSYLVINKECEYPEKVIEVLLGSYKFHWIEDLTDEWKAKRQEYDDKGVIWGVMPFGLQIERVPIAQERAAAFSHYFEHGNTDGLSNQCKQFIAAWEAYLEDPQKLTGWGWKRMMYDYGILITDDCCEFKEVCFWGITETMEDVWTTLETMEQETFVKIIMGEYDISEFDNFVDKWNELGGSKITDEVQEYVDTF